MGQKAKKSPQKKPVETSLDDEKKEEAKKSPSKSKKMQSMGKGLKYRDMKQGSGKAASNGDKVSVYYVGQTDDKKVFDKCIGGKGFEFTIGKGEVIKGWDILMTRRCLINALVARDLSLPLAKERSLRDGT